MYGIRETKDLYQTFTLYDTLGNSSFTINPERGGIVTDFQIDGIGNVLYMNDATYNGTSKYIRGGIPVLFPMVGRLSEDQYQARGKTYSMPVHGLIRNYPWEVRGTSFTDGARIVVGIKSNEEMENAYPFSFDVEFAYTLKGHTLTVEQCFTNMSDQDMPVSFGFHPYFKVPVKKNARVELNADIYQDMVSKAMVSAEKIPDFTGEPEVGCLYFDVKGQKATLHTGDYRVEVKFDKNYRHVLLWSLPQEDFICVEPWTARPDALNTGEELIEIRRGACIRSFMEISVLLDAGAGKGQG